MGLPLPTMLRLAKENNVTERTEDMILDAYSFPRYEDDSVKADAIVDFADNWYLDCIKNYEVGQ